MFCTAIENNSPFDQACDPVHAGASLAGNDSNDASSTGSGVDGGGTLRLPRRNALPSMELPSQTPSAKSVNEYTHGRSVCAISPSLLLVCRWAAGARLIELIGYRWTSPFAANRFGKSPRE